MEESSAERTEPATPKRREDARRKGEVAQSRDLSAVLVLTAALVLALSPLTLRLGLEFETQSRLLWGATELHPASLNDYHALLLQLILAIARAALPLAALLAGAAALAAFVQVGPLFSFEALAFRWEKLDPIAGLKRMLSWERIFDLAKSFLKVAAVAAAAWWAVRPVLGTILALAAGDVRSSAGALTELAVRLGVAVLIALGALAVADLFWVRWRHEEKLRMSRREVRDELKQREGSPEVRSRIRAMQRELSRSRMIAEVADADVVVRNPTHYAVALCYMRRDMTAPRVVAKGRNRVALRILEAARRHGVPVVENPPLAQLLYRTARVGREIPAALYEAVAEVLAYVYRLDRSRASAWRGGA